MIKLKWNDEKIEILKDEFEYADLSSLAVKLGVTVKAVRKKAEKLKLKRATNNMVLHYDIEYKYCSFCKCEHPLLDDDGKPNFHKDKHASYNLKYYCKKYGQQKSLNLIKSEPTTLTLLLNQKRGNSREYGVSEYEKVVHRPINPVVVVDGVEGKICNLCKEWKTLECYSVDQGGIAKKKARCKDCYKEMYSRKK